MLLSGTTHTDLPVEIAVLLANIQLKRMKKIICFLFGHNDPVMTGLGIISQEELYQNWLHWNRSCKRCGKNLKPTNV